jgi:hypothetical protein
LQLSFIYAKHGAGRIHDSREASENIKVKSFASGIFCSGIEITNLSTLKILRDSFAILRGFVANVLKINPRTWYLATVFAALW